MCLRNLPDNNEKISHLVHSMHYVSLHLTKYIKCLQSIVYPTFEIIMLVVIVLLAAVEAEILQMIANVRVIVTQASMTVRLLVSLYVVLFL
ncbi:unnamed protein product [Onchocerca flexuosa]|uniref:Transmembrane protein n=1 Tax=Onchocerca flexuosa TaxID=387005 RepID=A0A183HLM4_9BILA|nr:unnamed protein product [Onchocerca flexuosa]